MAVLAVFLICYGGVALFDEDPPEPWQVGVQQGIERRQQTGSVTSSCSTEREAHLRWQRTLGPITNGVHRPTRYELIGLRTEATAYHNVATSIDGPGARELVGALTEYLDALAAAGGSEYAVVFLASILAAGLKINDAHQTVQAFCIS
jgi:hypothetical protein